MVRKTHQTIWIVFALFVAYLALVRVVITWAQFAPAQFSSTLEWLTDSEISYESLTIKQGWLGVDIEVQEALVEHKGLEVEAGSVAFDFNLFSPLMPRTSWGSYLTVQNLAVLEYELPSDSDTKSSVSVERFLSFNSEAFAGNVDVSRFWKKIEVNEFTATIYQNEVAWKINVDSLQAFKGARWSLAADFNLHYGQTLQGERFQLKASLMPNVFGGIEYGDFTIKAYDAIRLGRLAQLTPQKWRDVLPDGELIANVKGVISKSLLSNLNVELNAPTLSWQNSDASLPKSIGLNLEWQNQAKIYDGSQTNWQFLLSQIQLDDQFIQTISPINVQLVSKRFLHIETDAFDIKPFKPLVKAILINESIAQLLDASAELTLKNVVADMAVPELYFENIAAEISTLAIPVTDLPGLALQDLIINKTGQQITVHTDKPLWVMYPKVHPTPMRFDFKSDLAGLLDVPNGIWSFEPWSLAWDDMPLTLAGSGDFLGKLDVSSSIESKTIAKVKSYLPYSIMSSKLETWLKSALVGGNTGKGQFFFKGNLHDYPFKEGGTTFGGSINLNNATFQFHKDWPQLENLQATLNWRNFSLEILADKLLLQKGVNAKAINVQVGPLNEHDIAVEFSANAQGESASAVDYLLNSPLPNKLGLTDLLANKQKIDLQGPVDVSLQRVWVPVSGFEEKSVLVDGSVKLNKTDLTLFDTLSIKELAGLLKFNETGVSAQKVNGLFEEGPATFSATSQNGLINIVGDGLAQIDQPSLAKGAASWTGRVSIPIKSDSQQETEIQLEVDGSKLNWLMPAPLDNRALQGKLQASLAFQKEGVRLKGQINELGFYDLYFTNKNEEMVLSKGAINFGSENVKPVKESGVLVSGQLPLLDLDKWGRWTAPEFNQPKQEPSLLKNIEWLASKVRFDEVKFIDYGYKQVDVTWQNAFSQAFKAKIFSEQVSADLSVQPEGQFDVKLDWLQIFLPINSMQSDLSNEQRESLIETCAAKPLTTFVWPNLSFVGKNIRIDQIGVPSLSFQVEDTDRRLHFKNIKAVLEGKAGELKGEYYFYKQQKLSNADIQLKSSSVQSLTELMGLKKGFSGDYVSVKSSIVWMGGLECFNLLGLLGKTEYQLKDGVIEDVEPGFARLLGLLNVTSLARRLSLDLKDVTTKGFAYDTIKGETHFINGKLALKGFELKAPSASVQLKGDVDLIQRAFNLQATVIPALGSSLPALSALTGVATPLGALAVYALMKVIPELNEDLVTYRYKVTGPWNAPIIDDGKKPEEPVNKGALDEILQRD